ncbi:MAG: hypothetical protein Q8N33_14190 [Rhodocyclaceae bacterium]|nr:hypothetical protein [Rhodocyclaceae bacterium]
MTFLDFLVLVLAVWSAGSAAMTASRTTGVGTDAGAATSLGLGVCPAFAGAVAAGAALPATAGLAGDFACTALLSGFATALGTGFFGAGFTTTFAADLALVALVAATFAAGAFTAGLREGLAGVAVDFDMCAGSDRITAEPVIIHI